MRPCFCWPTRAGRLPAPNLVVDGGYGSITGTVHYTHMRAYMQQASISAIEYYLPDAVVSTSDLAAQFPEWSVEKIDRKTGIERRHIAAADQCSSDLAFEAASKLFASGKYSRNRSTSFFCDTQSPDYFLPTTACILQNRLGNTTTAGALDFNLGYSGFVYGLGLAQGLVSSGQASNVLLLTAETYTKFLHERDRSVRTIFGDAAAATLITAVEADRPYMGPFLYGTDGRARKPDCEDRRHAVSAN